MTPFRRSTRKELKQFYTELDDFFKSKAVKVSYLDGRNEYALETPLGCLVVTMLLDDDFKTVYSRWAPEARSTASNRLNACGLRLMNPYSGKYNHHVDNLPPNRAVQEVKKRFENLYLDCKN
jgi:hypothetical protein